MYNNFGQSITLLASANYGDGVSAVTSNIYQVAFVDDQADFISRCVKGTCLNKLFYKIVHTINVSTDFLHYCLA